MEIEGMATTRDFFAMFEVPFRYGQPWTAADDERSGRVAILSKSRAEAIFGNADPVGKRFRMWGSDFTVVGVPGHVESGPALHEPHQRHRRPFPRRKPVYVPFATGHRSRAALERQHELQQGFRRRLQGAARVRLHLDDRVVRAGVGFRSPALQSWLDAYAAEQQKAGASCARRRTGSST
jgi:putative ABC transport system permease protein